MITTITRETNKLYDEAFKVANLQYLKHIILSSDNITKTEPAYDLDCRNKLLTGSISVN